MSSGAASVGVTPPTAEGMKILGLPLPVSKSKRTEGGLVKMITFVPEEMYQFLAQMRDPYDARWESKLIRNIILEWMQLKQLKVRK